MKVQLFKNHNFSDYLIAIILLLISLQCIYALLQLHVFPPSESLFKLTGTFVNPDHLAGYVASGFPLALGILIFKRKESFLYYISLTCVILSIMILPATMIRGAWIATFIGTIVVIYYRYRNESSILNILSKRWIKFSVVPLILILLTIFSIALYQLKPDSVNGRLLIWKVTSDMITDHPLTGVGVGQFQSTV